MTILNKSYLHVSSFISVHTCAWVNHGILEDSSLFDVKSERLYPQPAEQMGLAGAAPALLAPSLREACLFLLACCIITISFCVSSCEQMLGKSCLTVHSRSNLVGYSP